MVAMPGAWKNFDDLEENLCIEEIQILLKVCREKEHEDRKFLAAIQGVDIDKASGENGVSAFDKIKNRAEAKLAGVSTDELEFGELGFGMVTQIGMNTDRTD